VSMLGILEQMVSLSPSLKLFAIVNLSFVSGRHVRFISYVN
jgi:hypothetical protein